MYKFQIRSFDTSVLNFLSTLVVTVVLFELTLMFALTTTSELCAANYWQPSTSDIWTPYFGFLANAVLLFIWFIVLTIRRTRKIRSTFWLFVFTCAVFFYFWFKAFWGLWYFFEVERKEMTVLTFQNKMGGTPKWLNEQMLFKKPVQCKLLSNKPLKQDK